MIDVSKANKDFSKEEIYAIEWFNENGFDGYINKPELFTEHQNKLLKTA